VNMRPRSAVLQISADGVQDNFNAIYLNPPGVLGSDPNLGCKDRSLDDARAFFCD
jgi:hypothetical protein